MSHPSKRISQQELESYLWGAAVLLRGLIDAGDYKQFIFPLLFYKRVSDVWEEEYQAALANSKGDLSYAQFAENHRFQIPQGAHWNDVRQAPKNVGAAIQKAMRAIETANPDLLDGIFGDAPWTNRERLPDETLKNLIEHFSTQTLSVANVPEDELGNAYEYLIKKFADDSGHTAAEFYTNRTVVHLMTQLLAPQAGESIYDPTCGTGGMLISALDEVKRSGGEYRTLKLYGQVLAATRECADAYKASESALKTLLLSRTDELFSGQMEDEAKAQVIGDIAEVQYGLTINAKRREIEKQSPYLRVANVQRFHIDLSEVKDVGVDSKDDGCILQRNDILVVEGHADIAELGRASIWEAQLPICLHQNHLIRIRCRPEVDPYYVLEYVNSPAGRAYFRGRGKSTSGLNTLNSTVVREMPIPIPPLATQKSIADELKAARRRLKDIADRKEQHAAVSKRLSMEIFGEKQG